MGNYQRTEKELMKMKKWKLIPDWATHELLMRLLFKRAQNPVRDGMQVPLREHSIFYLSTVTAPLDSKYLILSSFWPFSEAIFSFSQMRTWTRLNISLVGTLLVKNSKKTEKIIKMINGGNWWWWGWSSSYRAIKRKIDIVLIYGIRTFPTNLHF